MQKCVTCGNEIRYIATTNMQSVMCDAEEITVYTITGRKVSGYKKHDCLCQEGKKDGEQRTN